MCVEEKIEIGRKGKQLPAESSRKKISLNGCERDKENIQVKEQCLKK